MIKKVHFKFGSSAEKSPLEITAQPLTVFVGPNNSGKSKVLEEIEKFCRNESGNNLILNLLEFTEIANVEDFIARHTLIPKPDESIPEEFFVFGKNRSRNHVRKEGFLETLSDLSKNYKTYCSIYVSHDTMRISGSKRTNLTDEQKVGDLLTDPVNHLQILFTDDDKRKEVRRIVYDAFKKYFVIDPTKSGFLRIRLSE